MKLSEEARFWAKVSTGEGCWTWNGFSRRYGRFKGSGGQLAHRISWRLHYGAIPPGMNVLHRCDNPPCVRPDHLFLGTQMDNVNDMIRKGRRTPTPRGAASAARLHPERMARGERCGRAKLTAVSVASIRALAGELPQRQIAKMFGVCQRTIVQVASRKTWRHV